MRPLTSGSSIQPFTNVLQKHPSSQHRLSKKLVLMSEKLEQWGMMLFASVAIHKL